MKNFSFSLFLQVTHTQVCGTSCMTQLFHLISELTMLSGM